MSNPFGESFAQFILTGELPTAQQMREQIEQYESEEK